MDSAHRPVLKLKQYVSEIGLVSILKLKIKLIPAQLDPTIKTILSFWYQRLQTLLLSPHMYNCVKRFKKKKSIGRCTPVKHTFLCQHR